MPKSTVRTGQKTICLPNKVAEMATANAKRNSQTIPAYLRSLVERDIEGVKPTGRRMNRVVSITLAPDVTRLLKRVIKITGNTRNQVIRDAINFEAPKRLAEIREGKRAASEHRSAAIREAVAAVRSSTGSSPHSIGLRVPPVVFNRFKAQVEKTAKEFNLSPQQAQSAVASATFITLFKP